MLSYNRLYDAFTVVEQHGWLDIYTRRHIVLIFFYGVEEIQSTRARQRKHARQFTLDGDEVGNGNTVISTI